MGNRRELDQSFLASNLRYLRKRKKLSLENLVIEMEIHHGVVFGYRTYYQYEKKMSQPSLMTLDKLCKFYGTDMQSIYSEDLSKNNF